MLFDIMAVALLVFSWHAYYHRTTYITLTIGLVILMQADFGCRQQRLAFSIGSQPGSMLQGVYCGKQPYKVIAMCLIAIAVCCLGLLRFQVETDPQRLWVGSGSLAAREKAQYEVMPTA